MMNVTRVPFNKEECCGCGVCADICPKHAIVLVEDAEGFFYPSINDALCINCGICLKNCSFINRTKKDVELKAFVAKHKNETQRMNSRSGGVFVSCSDYILDQGGVVYGCTLDGCVAKTIRATDASARNSMCKSKYIQSDTSGTWKLIKEDILAGKKILFSGTGCQVDALYSYCKIQKLNTDLLYTMDLICHGVPSPKLFREFIAYLKLKHNAEITNFEFRDKTLCGWDDHIESYIVNGKKYSSIDWRELYYSNCIDRPSCYNCKYAATNRVGDITFADAWGIRKADSSMYDNKGISVVFINSLKGNELLNQINDTCFVKEVEFKHMDQYNLHHSSKPNYDREKFWDDYNKGGIPLLINLYSYSPIKLIYSKVRYLCRKILKGKTIYLP